MARPCVQHYYGAYIIGRSLYQTDYDFPSAAKRCGLSLARIQWRPDPDFDDTPEDPAPKRATLLKRLNRKRLSSGADCYHSGTDGTIDCRDCGIKATAFIMLSSHFLDEVAE